MPNVSSKDRGAIKKRSKNLFKRDLNRDHQGVNETLGFTIDSGEHKKASKKAKLRNLAKGNTNLRKLLQKRQWT